MSVESKYVYTTATASVRDKDWAAGPRHQEDSNEYVIDKKLNARFGKVTYSPAWYKTIDELIVNALDHAVRCAGKRHKVTTIEIGMTADGRISVYNDGPGIEILIHKVASKELGYDVWVPEFVMGHLFQGSNRTKVAYPDTIIGGTNGIGAKLANIYSESFSLETVWGGKHYRQSWSDQMNVRDPPIITDAETGEFTKIVFRPVYSVYGYESLDRETAKQLCDIVRTRVHLAAVYIGRVVRDVSIKFNGVVVPTRSMIDYAGLLSCEVITSAELSLIDTANPAAAAKSSAKKDAKTPYTWEVVIGHRPMRDAPAAISVVNGIVVTAGTHIKTIYDKLIAAVKAEVLKRIKATEETSIRPSVIKNELCLLINAKVPCPGWTGQRKDVLSMNKQWQIPALPADVIAAVTNAVQEKVISSIATSQTRVSRRPKVEGYSADKYQPADKLGAKSSLLLAEGDSAMGQVKTGIARTVGFRHYGIISLGGVIINARREIQTVLDSNPKQFIQSTKFQNNKLMIALREFIGLVPGRHYETARERASLRYGAVIACVDQDHDGVGNIFGLILNLFAVLWPALLRDGYVRRFETPRQRAFPKAGGLVISFYTDAEYRRWLDDNPDAATKYTIKYYKGLATHSRPEVEAMFDDFEQQIYTYYPDDESTAAFETYFGADPELRKVALSRPVNAPTDAEVAEQERTKIVSCTDHLQYETHLFQCDSILRHLVSAMDGMSQGGRLIFHGAQRQWSPGSSKPAVKVAQLAGIISAKENYLHGEESLNKSITGKAFLAPGGRQIPQLMPFGNFGSRLAGGSDAGSPRYIYTKLNSRAMDLIYPAADYPLLEFEWDEGKRGAPAFYVPVIPTSILEHVDMPGHGWSISVWARNAFSVINIVRGLIAMGSADRVVEPPPEVSGWTGTIADIRGVPHTYGRYHLDKVSGDNDDGSDSDDGLVSNVSRRLIITELPLRVWTNRYLADLAKRKNYDAVVADIRAPSDDRKVRIEVTLHPGALDLMTGDMAYTDKIEEWFLLRQPMHSRLNMIGVDNAVIEFTKYGDVIRYWFTRRRDLYIARVERELAIFDMRIRAYGELHRYLTTGPRLRDMGEDEMCEHLLADKYPRIWFARVTDPKFLSAAELADVFDGPKANYEWALNARDRDRSTSNVTKLADNIAKLRVGRDELAARSAIGKFRGAQIWLDELDKIEKVITEGKNTEWLFGEANKWVYSKKR